MGKQINLSKDQIIDLIRCNEQTARENLASYVDKDNNVSKKDCIATLNILKNNIIDIIDNYYKGYTVEVWNRDTVNPRNTKQLISDMFLRYAEEDIISHVTKKLWISNAYNKVDQIVDYAINYLINYAEAPENAEEMKNNHEAIMNHFKNIYAKRFKITIEEMYFYHTFLGNLSDEYQELIEVADGDIKEMLYTEWVEAMRIKDYFDSIIYTLNDEEIKQIEEELKNSKYSEMFKTEKALYEKTLKAFRKRWDLENEEFENELSQFMVE